MYLKTIFTAFILFFAEIAFSQEICDNNIDDDRDGKIDLFDVEDCPCVKDSVSNALIANGSFENVHCVALGLNYLNCADGWGLPTSGTSDLYMQSSYFPEFIPTPLPDGNNCAGFLCDWGSNEYISSCLTQPMLAGESYIFQFDVVLSINTSLFFPKADLSLFGKPVCDTVQMGFNCLGDGGYWDEIGKVTYLPQYEWSKVEMLIEPDYDISSIALGSSCGPNSPVGAYFLVDNLKLEQTKREAIYYVPNAFTPNGDEFNQYFKPVFVCSFDKSDYSFEVYNRWGELVFVSFNAEVGWDGTYEGQLAKGDVFGWKIIYKNENSTERKMITGSVSLLK